MKTLLRSNIAAGISRLRTVASGAVVIGSLCFAPVSAFAATSTYSASQAIFPNPERGFDFYPGKCQKEPWTKEYLESKKAEVQASTLVRCVFYLPKDQDQIPDQVARFANQAKITKDVGVKMILRFAYVGDEGGPDAPLTTILSHLNQLEGTLKAHKDVIAVIESGFIGQWGEGHTSSNFPDNDWVNRKKVVDRIHDILPGRMVQVRKPKMKMEMYGQTPGLNTYVGHHNDCFLATFNDRGTYSSNMEAEKNFLDIDTLNVAMGGEACALNPPRSECPVAAGNELQKGELERFHYSYLNGVFNPDVFANWQAGNCLDKIRRQLGYRLVLTESTFPASVKKGTTLGATISVRNEGWAAPINSRSVYLELRNRVTGAVGAKLLLKTNIQAWKPGTTVSIDVNSMIPSTVPVGDYDLFLRMPDPSAVLAGRPEYEIKLANEDVNFKGVGQTNQLWHTLRITQ